MLSEKEIRSFYREAMGKRWSNNTSKKTRSTIPDHKMFTYRQGNLLCVECCSDSSNNGNISGIVNIFCDEELIWTLQYYGFCEKTARPFLASVLSTAFHNNSSIAGRGPKRFEGERYIYLNPGQRGYRIDKFQGQEKIVKVGLDKIEKGTRARISFRGGLIEKITV
jgi:hypothetical protein